MHLGEVPAAALVDLQRAREAAQRVSRQLGARVLVAGEHRVEGELAEVRTREAQEAERRLLEEQRAPQLRVVERQAQQLRGRLAGLRARLEHLAAQEHRARRPRRVPASARALRLRLNSTG